LHIPKATTPFYWHAHANEQIGLYQGKLYVADPKGRFCVKWSSNCNLAPESLHKSGRERAP